MPRTSQDFVPIEEIRDGFVILKNGEMRTVLMVSTINFDLKSQDEQRAVIASYQSFLNSLDFSIQIFCQSRHFDVLPYLHLLEDREKQEMNELLKIQIQEYIQFIRGFTENTNIMTKTFYVVVPYAPALLGNKKSKLGGLLGRSKKRNDVVDLEQFEQNRSQLEQRESIVSSGLERLGLRTLRLGTEELVELYYKIFNPGEHHAPKYSQ